MVPLCDVEENRQDKKKQTLHQREKNFRQSPTDMPLKSKEKQKAVKEIDPMKLKSSCSAYLGAWVENPFTFLHGYKTGTFLNSDPGENRWTDLTTE